MNSTAAVVIVILLLIGFLSILRKPLKLALKLLFNTIGGFIALIFINFFGAIFGISLGVNWINALVVGVFGLPGVALLLILQWLLKI